MTPFELGELRKKEALAHLVVYLHGGSDNDKRLAASAIVKLMDAGINCSSTIPFLLKNVTNERPQVRQYTMNTLKRFTLPADAYDVIKHIALTDDKEYNREVAKDLLKQAGVPLDINSAYHSNDTAETTRISEKGFVYFIQEDYAGRIKIGKTKNMEQRMETFDVKLPFNIELIHVIESQNHHYTEKLFHVYFANKRVNGEWFELGKEDIDWIKSKQYTKKIMESLESVHIVSKEPRVVPASEKQLTFLSNLLTNKNAILMKPLKKLSMEEATSIISHLYRGEAIPPEINKLIFYQEQKSM